MDGSTRGGAKGEKRGNGEGGKGEVGGIAPGLLGGIDAPARFISNDVCYQFGFDCQSRHAFSVIRQRYLVCLGPILFMVGLKSRCISQLITIV